MKPLAAVIVAALVLAACGEDDGEEPSAATTTATEETAGGEEGDSAEDQQDAEEKPSKPKKPGTAIAVGDSQFGEIIFDDSNQAIYLFDKETSSKPECYGECAAGWPPVLTKGEPVAKGGAKQNLLGTTKRDDGSTQVTYAGQPLYYYAHEDPGQVLCHNVNGFGGLWLVLDASGDALS